LREEGGFLGDTAKRAPESAAGLDFPHHIIGVGDAELKLWSGLCKREME